MSSTPRDLSAWLSPDDAVFVAGHRGLVGGAILKALRDAGHERILVRSRDELDLREQRAVFDFFERERPAYVFLAAAKVGGILANSTQPAPFIYDNLTIASNVIHAAHCVGTKKLLNLGSSCIYPKHAPQPMTEDALLTGPLEPTNQPYAVAKIAAIEMCDAYRRQYGSRFISAMPTNLYGPGDNFDLETSHVLPALIRRFWEAKQGGADHVTLWGTGSPLREFLYVEDLAAACLFLMGHFDAPGPINVGTGKEISIRGVAELIAELVGFEGELRWDATKPDGTPRKLMDVGRLAALGWTAPTPLRAGLEQSIDWFVENVAHATGM
jgi:GDP-L-fucose synthase